jgi:PEP-CTERM motif
MVTSPLGRRVLTRTGVLLLTCGAMAGLAGSAHALVITPVFASSITSLSNAATVEGAINQAIDVYEQDFSSNVDIQIEFSFGTIDGQKVAAGDASESISYMYTGFSYADVVSELQEATAANPGDATLASAVAHLPATNPTGMSSFSITEADAQALGLTPPSGMGIDGYVGFNTALSYDYNTTGSTAAGEYDFVALAEHEMSEVMGRLSGLSSAKPTYATPYDLFRYSAPGKNSFSYSTAAYFSVNGGQTDLAAFNSTGGGDRGDWLTTSTSADAYDATATTGANLALSAPDIDALDALGWNTADNPGGWVTADIASTHSVALAGDLPEPGAWSLMILGAGFAGASLRRRRSSGVQVA